MLNFIIFFNKLKLNNLSLKFVGSETIRLSGGAKPPLSPFELIPKQRNLFYEATVSHRAPISISVFTCIRRHYLYDL